MVADKKCKNCGNKMLFNPKTQKMYCEYCKSERDIVVETNDQTETNNPNLDLYTCPSCGAKIVCEEHTTSTFCVYCKNTAILKDKMKGIFHPQAVIPFQATREEAVNAFINLREGKKLIPDEFLDPKNIEEIKGIYIPFWFFDFAVDGILTADTTKKTATRFGNVTTITIEYFNCVRKGNLIYDNIPIDASIHFQDNIMRSIEPFDKLGLKPYSSDYLSGFLSELFTVNEEDASKIAIERAGSTAYNTFYESISYKNYDSIKIKNNDFRLNKLETNYVLLPVYMLNVKYKDQFYTFAMNGQTKKIIGNIPIDEKKSRIYLLKKTGYFLIITLIIAIIIWKLVW